MAVSGQDIVPRAYFAIAQLLEEGANQRIEMAAAPFGVMWIENDDFRRVGHQLRPQRSYALLVGPAGMELDELVEESALPHGVPAVRENVQPGRTVCEDAVTRRAVLR